MIIVPNDDASLKCCRFTSFLFISFVELSQPHILKTLHCVKRLVFRRRVVETVYLHVARLFHPFFLFFVIIVISVVPVIIKRWYHLHGTIKFYRLCSSSIISFCVII